MKRSIRPAERSDVVAMHAIRLAVRENPLSAASKIGEASYLPYVDARRAWVAEREDAIVGFAAMDAATEDATANVWALFVDPAIEGKGVGRALHDELLEWARDHEIERLKLETAAGTRAERFYEMLGWEAGGYDEHGQIRFARSSRT